MNQQPWRYIYATRDDEQQFSKLFECLADGNKIWNKHVPVLILSIAEIFPDNAEKENYYAFHDTGLANQNLMLQAVSMGMFAHPMGGFSKRKAVETFQIPDNFAPAAMIAVGYKATHDNFPDEVLAKDRKERTRKPVKSIVSKVGFDF
jgi:nitroreductase